MRRLRFVLLVFAICAGFSTQSTATLITLDAIDSGWYLSDGSNAFHGSDNDNYISGTFDFGSYVGTYNNFFVFDLSGITDNILSATLSIFNPSPFGGDGTYTTYDVSTDASVLRAGGGSLVASRPQPGGVQPIFDDLGSGTSYSSTAMGLSDAFQFVDNTLNSAAIADLNATSDFFSIGGFYTPETFLGSFTTNRAFCCAFADPSRRLILETDGVVVDPPVTVPEPATLALFVVGLVGMGLARRRRKV